MNRKYVFFSLFLIILVAPGSIFAEVSLKARVDKTRIALNQAVTYTLTIVSTERVVAQPEFPKFTGFAIASQQQSSTISFQKNGMKSVLSFKFVLLPQEEGSFKIEPASIKMRNQLYQSEAFKIEVTPPQVGGHREMPGQRIVPPKKRLPFSNQPQITL